MKIFSSDVLVYRTFVISIPALPTIDLPGSIMIFPFLFLISGISALAKSFGWGGSSSL